MKFLKYSALVIVLLALVAGAAGFALWQWVDTGRVVTLIQDNVRKATGRELSIRGAVTPALSFYPTLEVADIVLSNPSWAKQPIALKAKTLKVGIALMPLLKGQTRITHVALDGADIHLERSVKGTASWQMTAKHKAAQPQSGDQKKPSADTLTIEQLAITDSVIHYIDHQKTKPIKAKVASLDIKGFNGRTLDYIAFEGSINGIRVVTNGSLTDGDLVLIDGTAEQGNNRLTAKGSFAIKDLTFDMKLDIDAPDVASFAKKLDAPLSNKIALKASLTLGGTPDAITFSDLNAVVGENDVKGSGRITIGAGTPYVEAHLTSDKINMTSKQVVNPSPENALKAPEAPQSDDIVFPTQLNQINANLQWNIKELLSNKMTMRNISLAAEMKEGVIRIKPLKLELASGTVDATATYDSMKAPPFLQVRALMNGVVLGELLSQLSADASALQDGKSMGEFRAKGQGNTLNEWLASTDGTLNFFVDQSSYQLDGITEKADAFVSVLSGKDEQTGKMNIECVAGNFDVVKGLATSEWLALKTSNALATGAGTVSLPDQRLDMVLKARSAVIGFADMVPPLRLRGSLSNPKVKIDTMGSVVGIGKMVLGATTGVGLAAVLGEKVADKLGITSDNNPCLTSIAKIQQQPEPTIDDFNNTVQKIEDAVKSKKDDLKIIEDNAKQLRDGFEGLFKKN